MPSSDLSDFFSQIGGLIVFTCAVGLVWLVLVLVVAQRASERRRRAQQGLPPLPGIHTVLLNRLRGGGTSARIKATPAPSRPLPSSPPPARTGTAPMPDLALLTADLPVPDLSALDDTPPADEAASQEDSIMADTPLPDLPPVPEPAHDLSAPESSPTAETSAPPDAVELLRVWRDLSDGRLIVEIGGRRFTSLADLRSADLERRFLSVVRELDAMARPAQKPPRPETPAAPRPDVPPASTMRPGAMLRQMSRVAMGQTPEPSAESAPLSIADQIEELLQARLADLPSMRTRSIHVRPSLQGGVRIEVDGKFYESTSEVEDSAVRDLLQDVVREWESRQ